MVLPLDMHFHRNPYEERLDFGTFPCVVKSTSERRPMVPDRPSHSHCNTNQKSTSLLTPSCHPTMDDNSAPTASGQNHAAGSQTTHAPFQTPMNPTHPHSRPSRPQRPAATTPLETVKVTPSLSLKKLALQFVATLKDIEDVRVVKGAIGDEIEIDDVYGNRYVVLLVGLNFRFVDEVRGVMGGGGAYDVRGTAPYLRRDRRDVGIRAGTGT